MSCRISQWDPWCALGEITLTPSKPMLDTTQFLLFVDGTCTSLRNRLVRVAGAACTVVQGEWSHEFLKGSVVPGAHQNSGRAEILAGILAVSFAWTVEVRSDYLLFTQRAQELLQGNSVGAAWCNQDLWGCFQGCFQGLIAGRRDVIKICKVPAHKNWKTLQGRARFDAYHNAMVDVEAKQVAERLFPDVHRLHSHALRVQSAQRQLAKSNLEFVGQSAEQRFALPPVQVQVDTFNLQRLESSSDGRACASVPVSASWFASLSLPRDFVQSVLTWAATLKWGCTTRPNVDSVSFVELYLRWSCSSGHVMLHKLEAAKNWKKATWITKDACETQAIACFKRDIRAWTCLLKHLLAQGAIAWDVQFRCSVRSLAVVGYSPNVAGITPRPSMPDMVVVLQWLRAKLIASGTAMRKLDFELKQPPLQLR